MFPILLLSIPDIPNLRGFWPLTVRYGGRDVSVHGNDGAVHDVDYMSVPCWSQIAAPLFKGTMDSYFTVGGDGGLDITTGEFTWTAWIKPNISNVSPLFSFYHPTHNNNLGLHIFNLLLRTQMQLRKGENKEGVARALGISPFFMNAYMEQAKTYSTGSLWGCLGLLRKADWQLRSSARRRERALMDMLVIQLCSVGRPRGA